MDIVEEIYQNSICPSERRMNSDKIYRKSKNQVKQCYETLCQRLSDYEITVLDKLMLCNDRKTERTNVYCFADGFKKGMAVMLESLK